MTSLIGHSPTHNDNQMLDMLANLLPYSVGSTSIWGNEEIRTKPMKITGIRARGSEATSSQETPLTLSIANVAERVTSLMRNTPPNPSMEMRIKICFLAEKIFSLKDEAQEHLQKFHRSVRWLVSLFVWLRQTPYSNLRELRESLHSPPWSFSVTERQPVCAAIHPLSDAEEPNVRDQNTLNLCRLCLSRHQQGLPTFDLSMGEDFLGRINRARAWTATPVEPDRL